MRHILTVIFFLPRNRMVWLFFACGVVRRRFYFTTTGLESKDKEGLRHAQHALVRLIAEHKYIGESFTARSNRCHTGVPKQSIRTSNPLS